MLQPCGDLVDVVQQSEQYRQQCIDVIIRKLGPYSRISEPAINMESLMLRSAPDKFLGGDDRAVDYDHWCLFIPNDAYIEIVLLIELESGHSDD